MTSLYFRLKGTESGKGRILDLFFRDWVDSQCNNEVQYKIEELTGAYFTTGQPFLYKKIRVDFEKQEDATALVLRGIPAEFKEYLEFAT